jgi:hypothetical protein
MKYTDAIRAHAWGDIFDDMIEKPWANAFGTGLGGPDGPEPGKPSPPSAPSLSQVSSQEKEAGGQ